ncbi:MAG: type II secretion system secretin GspD [Nitrospirae bacterium]|nr:type II secretion system secretin GspD [Nitrospirota bacterium]
MKILLICFIALLLLLPSAGFPEEEKIDTGVSLTPPPSAPAVPAATAAPPAAIITPPAPPVTSPAVPSQAPPGASIQPPQPKPKEENYIILNFDNANLRDVINTISSITGENFIVSPGVDARVTIHSSRKIPVSEALNVFESILEVNGIGIVKSGLFYKIVPGQAVKQKPLEIKKGKEDKPDSPTDIPITQIVPVEYIPVTEAHAVLQPLLSQFGIIIPNPRNNLLIINDLASNISRLLSILEEIDVDVFQNTRMRLFQPKYSDVKTLAKELIEIINTLNIGKEGIALIPIERINSIIVFSASEKLLNSVEAWIKKLDEEATSGQNIFVFRVQNTKAADIEKILKALYETEEGSKPITTPAAPAARPPTPTLTPAKPGETTGFSRVKILTYEPTNSIVVLASSGMYREIEGTIRRLDVYPKEVLIEVLIAEVTLSDTMKFGIQWSILKNLEINAATDITGTGLLRSSTGATDAVTLPSTAPTLASGATGGLSYILFRPDKFVAMLHALASKGLVNVLSSPRLLVRDQQEASIDVGSEIPTATSTSQTTETTATVTQSIQYKTVGVKLKIKPNINDEKTVVLDVTQEVSDYSTDVTVGQSGYTYPAFSKREVKTSVVVPDQQALIIGGIIKERKSKSYQGIPLLSSIPILGHLFRYTINTVDKTELVVLLTPYIIAKKEEGDIITKEFVNKIKDLKESIEKFKKEYGEAKGPPQDENKPQ